MTKPVSAHRHGNPAAIRRIVGLLLVPALLLAGWWSWQLWDPLEPRLEGRRASELAQVAMSSAKSNEDQLQRTRAWRLLGELAPHEGSLALLKAYRQQNLSAIEVIVRNLRLYRVDRIPLSGWTTGLLEALYKSMHDKFWRQSEMVGELAAAPDPTIAVAVLVAHAKNDSAVESWQALRKMGLNAGPALVAYVRSHPDHAAAQTLLCLLQPFQPGCGEPDIGKLHEIFLRHPQPAIRALAALGMGKLGRHARPAIADLRIATTNQHEWREVSEAAAKSLQELTDTNSLPVPHP